MCGIAGLFPSTAVDAERYVRGMLHCLQHRGPDGDGIWTDSNSKVVLGHRRLAIIDLSSAGNQPMILEDGSIGIAFNGEIYNFKEIREELERSGVAFRSESDTEVVLKGYRTWGPAVLDRLVGMFAFAIWDDSKDQLFLARDRTGEKPLYYSRNEHGFAFASEITALAQLPWVDRELDAEALGLYLNYQYIPAPFSIYRGIRKLPPAHAMTVHHDDVKIWRYWDPISYAVRPRISVSPKEAIDQLEMHLSRAVRGQMVADVPLGAFLSGGFDSAAVVSFMVEHSVQPVKTFTIGFEFPGYDEAQYAQTVANHLGTDHTVEYLSEKDALSLVPSVPSMYGEPFADSSALPTHLVSKVARKFVTVSLSGDGGDEAFGGYSRYRLFRRLNCWSHMAASVGGIVRAAGNALPGRLQRVAGLIGQAEPEVYRGFVSVFTSEEVGRLLGRRPFFEEYERTWSLAAQIGTHRSPMVTDLLTYLPGAILAKVDRAAMAVSLETRAPFLDHRILEFGLQLPEHLLSEKKLIKEVVYRRIPKALMDRPKQGFAVPLAGWFRGELRNLLHDVLTPTKLHDIGIEDTKLVKQFLVEHDSGVRSHASRLWALLVLSLWSDMQHA